MNWYGWLLLGTTLGLIISEFLPAEVVIKGNIKQKGRDNKNTIEEINMPIKQRKRRLKGLINKLKK